jgi:hypothetical protein
VWLRSPLGPSVDLTKIGKIINSDIDRGGGGRDAAAPRATWQASFEV